jgi:elongation factor G
MGNAIHVISITVYPKTAEDATKLQAALLRLADEDPTLGYRVDSEPERAILAGISEGRLETVIDRLIRGFDVQVSVGDQRIAYRETITKTVEQDYTHKKSYGPRGEFARVKIRLEPLPQGRGFVFANAAGSRLPSEYAAVIGPALDAAARLGDIHKGSYPATDLSATLIDGAYHDIDSSARAFQIAADACFYEGIGKAGPQLLEPVMKVAVLTPEEFMGDVIGDLNRRGGAISGMSAQDTVRTIDALVPLRKMLGYASHLRAMTQGRASWTTQFDHYAPYWRGGDLDPIHPGAAMGLR